MGRAGADGGGLINPAEFVCRARYLDLEAIRESAGELRTYAGNLTSHMDTIAGHWQGLAPHYIAPESWRVLNLMGPAQLDANAVADVYEGIAGRLETYADELEPVKPALADLEQRAWDFRNSVKKGVEVSALDEQGWLGNLNYMGQAARVFGVDDTITVNWSEHGPTRDKNEDLLREYALLLEQISMSATDAANGIRRCHDFTAKTLLTQGAGPYSAVTADQVMAQDNPWGAPIAEKRSTSEQIGDGITDFGSGVVFGVTSMIGYHPDTGWAKETFTGTWTGIADFAQATTALTNPLTLPFVLLAGAQVMDVSEADRLSEVPVLGGLIEGQTDNATTLRDTWASMVGYDPYAQDGWQAWKDEPYRVGTGVLLNVGSCFAPAAGGVSAGAKTATAARAATIAAKTADVLVPLGSYGVKGGINLWRGGVNLTKGETITNAGANAGAKINKLGAAGVAADTIHTPTNPAPTNPATGLPENLLATKPLDPHTINYGPTGPPSHSIHTSDPTTPGAKTPQSLLWRDQPPRAVEPSATGRAAGEPITAPEQVAVPERVVAPEPALVGARPGHTTAGHGTTITNNSGATTTTGEGPSGHGTHTTSGGNGTTTSGNGHGNGNGNGTPTDRAPGHDNNGPQPEPTDSNGLPAQPETGGGSAPGEGATVHDGDTNHSPSPDDQIGGTPGDPTPSQGPLADDPRYAHLPVENQEAIAMYKDKIDTELAKDDPRYYRVNQWNGDIFNHENYHRYEAKEVILERIDPETMDPIVNPETGRPRRPVLDSYNPGDEVIFRRQTQLGTGGVQPSTAIRYISEAANHYGPNRPDIIIADTPSTRAQLGHIPGAIGNPLEGRLVFEVPEQRYPIPQEVLEHAAARRVIIRDVNGRVYRLEEALP